MLFRAPPKPARSASTCHRVVGKNGDITGYHWGLTRNKDTETVVSALINQARKLPDELYKSLTWDQEI